MMESLFKQVIFAFVAASVASAVRRRRRRRKGGTRARPHLEIVRPTPNAAADFEPKTSDPRVGHLKLVAGVSALRGTGER